MTRGALDIYVPSEEELEFRANLYLNQFEKPTVFGESMQEKIEDKTPEELEEESKMNQKVVPSQDYKKEKFIALYQARTIISKHGTMEERRLANRQLKRMKKLGAKAV